MTKDTKDKLTAFVCSRMQVQFDDVFKKSRKQNIVTTRQIIMSAMYVSDHGETLTSIVQYFMPAVTNHATVHHAVKTMLETHYLNSTLKQIYLDAIGFVELCNKLELLNDNADFYSKTAIIIGENLQNHKKSINIVEN